jgi:hypothetical protein
MEATRTRKKYSSIISGWRVFSLFGIAYVAGEPHGGLGLLFGNLLCMVGWEGSMGWIVFGGCFV